MNNAQHRITRRDFLAVSAAAWCGAQLPLSAAEAEPIIDIHQHTNYRGRGDEVLLGHQRAMGVTQTILLPAGSPVKGPSTHEGKSVGLAAGAGGNDTVVAMAGRYPKEFFFGANEVTDLPDAVAVITKYLKMGAVIIGESKFGVQCDSKESELLYKLAEEFRVPILLHFQEGTYNSGYDRFGKVVAKHPNTIFIGHAQTVWTNIDKNYDLKQGLYPTGPVTAGGLTDRYLAEHPNFFADMSAGSGLNALRRDEDHTRGFFDRHQDKILYGSDCNDANVFGLETAGVNDPKPVCQGAATIAAIRKLSPSKAVERKILYENSKKLFRL
jgi:predicted TIM-barrel fold metal-dependent hydrolase